MSVFKRLKRAVYDRIIALLALHSTNYMPNMLGIDCGAYGHTHRRVHMHI